MISGLRTYLLIFESADSVFLTLESECFHGVGPVFDSIFAGLLKALAVGVTHRGVSVFFGLRDTVLDSFELIDRDHNCTAFTDGLAWKRGLNSGGPCLGWLGALGTSERHLLF